MSTAEAPTWLTKALARQEVLLLCAVAALVALSGFLPSLSQTEQLTLIAVSVAILGVPHGAVDHIVARPLMKRLAGPAWLPSFFILYLAIAAAVIAIWRWQPVVSLALFLLVSALHFGLDALRERHDPIPRLGQLARITVRGVLPIALPSFLASAEVTEVYRLLLPADMLLKATLVERIASIALLSTAGLTVLAVVSEGTSTAIALAKSAVPLVLLYLFLPPLLAFAVFFCFDHSMRHVLELSHRFDPQRALRGARDFIWAALPLSLVTVLGGAAAFYYTRGAGDIDLALARTTFIGLAALTVPHMLVTEIAETATQEATAGRPPGRGGVQR